MRIFLPSNRSLRRYLRCRVLSFAAAAIGLCLFCVDAQANTESAGQIQLLCASRFAADAPAQASCREELHQAAADLMDRIELAAPESREYKAASACIEHAKVAQPAQIDWTKALRCYENRIAGAETAD